MLGFEVQHGMEGRLGLGQRHRILNRHRTDCGLHSFTTSDLELLIPYRLPPPTFCDLKTKIKACDAKYVFAKLNVDFCKQVNSFKCN